MSSSEKTNKEIPSIPDLSKDKVPEEVPKMDPSKDKVHEEIPLVPDQLVLSESALDSPSKVLSLDKDESPSKFRSIFIDKNMFDGDSPTSKVTSSNI